MERREFLKKVGIVAGAGAAAAAGAAYLRPAGAGDPPPPLPLPEETKKGDMPYRPFGSTGEKVSLVGLGGWHIGAIPTEKESIALMRAAIDAGINFFDNCWDYHGGKSELWMGAALRDGWRDKVFLMTKIDGRTREAAARQIDECLQRLGTDRIDLLQHHEVIREADAEWIVGEGGAYEALLAAQKAGKVRFTGFTGHKDPKWHLALLDAAAERSVRFDAVQMPLNVLDASYKSFEAQVLPRLVKDGIAPLAMKTLGGGFLLRSGQLSALECLHYAMGLPVATVITGMESRQALDQALQAVKTYRLLDAPARRKLVERTARVAGSGQFEPFKTTTLFDGTTQHPEWMGRGDGRR